MGSYVCHQYPLYYFSTKESSKRKTKIQYQLIICANILNCTLKYVDRLLTFVMLRLKLKS